MLRDRLIDALRNPELENPAGSPKSCRIHFHVMKLEEIATEASKLSEEERASLASRLLHGLETPVYEVSDPELLERMREAEIDPGVWLTFDQLVSGLKRRVS